MPQKTIKDATVSDAYLVWRYSPIAAWTTRSPTPAPTSRP